MKNPFSIYDFLGYLFPGILAMSMIVYFSKGEPDIVKFWAAYGLEKRGQESGSVFSLESSVILIILSYVLGHVISYLSSVFVENFTNKVYGYPSRYLLEEDDYTYKDLWKRFFITGSQSGNKCMMWIKKGFRYLLKFGVFIFLLPITLPVYTFGYLLDINHFITRPLDSSLRMIIKDKIKNLYDHLHIRDGEKVEDFHRIVMHYVYINVSNCQPKVNNYIALYGFMRCMAFLLCLFFDVLLCKAIYSVDMLAEIDWEIIVTLIVVFMVAYILFLAFVKFYRRNTLEDFMTLVVDDNLSKWIMRGRLSGKMRDENDAR